MSDEGPIHNISWQREIKKRDMSSFWSVAARSWRRGLQALSAAMTPAVRSRARLTIGAASALTLSVCLPTIVPPLHSRAHRPTACSSTCLLHRTHPPPPPPLVHPRMHHRHLHCRAGPWRGRPGICPCLARCGAGVHRPVSQRGVCVCFICIGVDVGVHCQCATTTNMIVAGSG